jgi:hypothetical protein
MKVHDVVVSARPFVGSLIAKATLLRKWLYLLGGEGSTDIATQPYDRQAISVMDMVQPSYAI